MTTPTPRILRVWDYAHLAVTLPSGETDWSPALEQLAVDAVDAGYHKAQQIYLCGEWGVTRPWELVAHRSIIYGGYFHVLEPFVDPLAPIVRISGNYSTIVGFMGGTGLGGTPLATRQTRTIFEIGDALDMVATGWEALTATHGGVICDPTQNQIGARFGTVHVRDIGSAAGAVAGHVARCELPYTARVDSGSHSSHLQVSRLSIDIVGLGWAGALEVGQPWVHRDSTATVQVGTVQDFDEAAGWVEVYPKLLDKNQQAGTLEMSWGIGFGTFGSNNTGTQADIVHGLRVGQLRVVGVNGGADGSLIAEDGCGVGLRWPATNGGSTNGYSVARLHAEGMVVAPWLDVGRSADTSVLIGATSGVDLADVWSLSPLRPDDFSTTADDAVSGVQGHGFETFRGAGVFHLGAWLTTPIGTEIGDERVAANTALTVHPSAQGPVPPVLRLDAPVINLEHVEGLHRWGHSSARISVVGAEGGNPTQITIKSTPQHGAIELYPGQTDPYLRVEPLAGGADILIYRDAGLWRVRVIPFV